MNSVKDTHVILDEAQCLIKDVGTANHRVYREFVEFKTPTIDWHTAEYSPVDAYAHISLVAPGSTEICCTSTNAHVTEDRHQGQSRQPKDLDILTENLLINAVRKLRKTCSGTCRVHVVSTVEYSLDPAHYKLYTTLANNKLLELPDGGKIDATQVSALFHALGQIVCQWSYFGQDEKLKAKAYSLVEE